MDNELRAFLMEMREEFRTEIAGIKKDISELKADVAKLDKRMEMVEFKQDVGNKKLKELNYSFVILDRRVDRDFSKIEDETDTIIQILRMNKLVSA